MEDEAFERPQDVRPPEGLEEAAPNPEGLDEAASIPEGFGAVLPEPEVPEATEPGLEAPEDVNVPSVEGPRHYEFDASNPYLAPEPPSRTPAWLELLMTVLGTLVLAVIIRVFIAETYEVPSGSMLETIQLGDRLVGEKVTLHWSEPVVGDIVTFNDPDGSGTTLIKRVVATEGQVVDLQDGYVLVDGKVISEPYVMGKPSYALDGHASNLSENVTFPYTVPAGCLWVMGDNRTNSLDSRYFGAIPLDSVTSKALFIYWPISDVGTL